MVGLYSSDNISGLFYFGNDDADAMQSDSFRQVVTPWRDTEAPTVGTPTVERDPSPTGTGLLIVTCSGEDTGGSGISAYIVEYKKSTDSTYTVKTVSSTATAERIVLSGLTSSTEYNIRVKVKDGAGNESLYSSVVSNTTPACFVAGTKVATPSGLINIEDLKIGDEVYSFNEETKKVETKKVINTLRALADEIMQLEFENGEIIENTERHSYYVVDKGWTMTKDLQAGDKVLTKDTKQIEISNITTKEMRDTTVYNLTIEDNHNYFVGNTILLVHNAKSIGF